MIIDRKKIQEIYRVPGLQTAWDARQKFTAESRKLYVEANKLYAESRKLDAEADKLYAEARKCYAEADKLYAESRKLTAEGDLIWINAWIRVHGKESIVDWNWVAGK